MATLRHWALSSVALAVVTGALALAPTAVSAPAPCAVLKNAEVTEALGSKVESKSLLSGSRGTCQWQGVSLSPANTYQVHRMLTVTLVPLTRAKFLKFAKRADALRIKGVGEIAFAQGNGNIVQLSVWQHGYSLTLYATTVTHPLEAEKVAARAAVARL